MTDAHASLRWRGCHALHRCLLTVLWLTSGLVESPAQADSMRCGGRLISDGKVPGTLQAEVLLRCGEPYDISGDQWLYVRGDAVYRVYFNKDREVSRILSEIIR